MDHAINSLKEHMNATIEMYRGMLSKDDLKPEIKAYVKAINELELYYYGEKRTSLENVLAYY